jgi:hypothetical protein
MNAARSGPEGSWGNSPPRAHSVALGELASDHGPRGGARLGRHLGADGLQPNRATPTRELGEHPLHGGLDPGPVDRDPPVPEDDRAILAPVPHCPPVAIVWSSLVLVDPLPWVVLVGTGRRARRQVPGRGAPPQLPRRPKRLQNEA